MLQCRSVMLSEISVNLKERRHGPFYRHVLMCGSTGGTSQILVSQPRLKTFLSWPLMLLGQTQQATFMSSRRRDMSRRSGEPQGPKCTVALRTRCLRKAWCERLNHGKVATFAGTRCVFPRCSRRGSLIIYLSENDAMLQLDVTCQCFFRLY